MHTPKKTQIIGETSSSKTTNEHGISHRRGFTSHIVQPIPDLRTGINSPPSSAGASSRPPFQGQYKEKNLIVAKFLP